MQIWNGSLSTILSCMLALATASAAQEQHPEHTHVRMGIANHPSTSGSPKRPTCRRSSSTTIRPRFTSSITVTLS
jgi:hypothetical protein